MMPLNLATDHMDVSERLQILRGAVEGCHVCAFIDLSSRMVLAVDARSKQPQERLDDLAERAEALFQTPCPSGDTAGQPTYLVVPLAENTEIFVRGSDTSVEALGLVCAPGTDLIAALEHCHRMLALLDEGR